MLHLTVDVMWLAVWSSCFYFTEMIELYTKYPLPLLCCFLLAKQG